jgi:acid phosphatase
MQHVHRFLSILPIALCAACAPLTREPANLSDLKAEITEYADSPTYAEGLAVSVASAGTYLTVRSKSGGENLTVIFDIDETVLSNLPHMKKADWGYQPDNWDAWVADADAPALAPVRDVYERALTLGYKVVFLSGRTEADRAATSRNLRLQGMETYEKLILRPTPKAVFHKEPALSFKTRVRKNLTAEGHTIVASFGDQDSDLEGGYAERTFKLPNPFYRIP